MTIGTTCSFLFCFALGYFEKVSNCVEITVLNLSNSPIYPLTTQLLDLAFIQPIASDRVEKVEKGA